MTARESEAELIEALVSANLTIEDMANGPAQPAETWMFRARDMAQVLIDLHASHAAAMAVVEATIAWRDTKGPHDEHRPDAALSAAIDAFRQRSAGESK